jgi:alkylhydroperoxidase family enzyme
MELEILTQNTAPDGSQTLLEGIAADLGFIPNLAATAAASPVLLAGLDGLRRAVGAEDVDPVHREIAGVAVGVAVDNRYGVAFHSTVLGRLGVDPADIDRMRAGQEPSEPSHAAVYAFARAVVIERGAVDAATVQRTRAAGLTESDLLDVVAECAFATLVGMVDNLAGHVELDGFLQPQAWA